MRKNALVMIVLVTVAAVVAVVPAVDYNVSGTGASRLSEGSTFINDDFLYQCEVNSDGNSVSITGEAIHSGYAANMSYEVAYEVDDTVVIPSVVTLKGVDYAVSVISDGAFTACSYTGIIIPASVEEMGSGVFENNKTIQSVVFEGAMTDTGDSTFAGCENLVSASLPTGLTAVHNSSFSGCTALKESVIPATVMKIESSAYADCASLTSVVIPDSVKVIGNNAFAGCIGLTNVSFSANLTSVSSSAFDGITFYAADGTTVLDPTAENLSGQTFSGTADHMVLGSASNQASESINPTYLVVAGAAIILVGIIAAFYAIARRSERVVYE